MSAPRSQNLPARTELADSSDQRILLRLASVAELTDSSIETVRWWIRTERLRALKIGRAVYVSRDDLLEFVESHRK